MTTRWNQKVSKNDSFLHLGDFCINKRKDHVTVDNIKKNSRALNGNKILIKGNHDKVENDIYLKAGWDYVIDRPHILLEGEMNILNNDLKMSGCIITEINNKRIMFSHFGVFTFDKRFESKYKPEFEYLKELYDKYDCELNIHGHSHSNSKATKTSFNCSVENINFTPLSVSDAILRTLLI